VPILIYYKMNPRFIKDVANIEGNRVHTLGFIHWVHISAMPMPMKTTMSMAIHFMVTVQVSGYYVYERV
jgi:hypothetical protein